MLKVCPFLIGKGIRWVFHLRMKCKRRYALFSSEASSHPSPHCYCLLWFYYHFMLWLAESTSCLLFIFGSAAQFGCMINNWQLKRFLQLVFLRNTLQCRLIQVGIPWNYLGLFALVWRVLSSLPKHKSNVIKLIYTCYSHIPWATQLISQLLNTFEMWQRAHGK